MQAVWAAFGAVLAVTKKVAVLIFALFVHWVWKGLSNRPPGRRFEGRRTKNGGAGCPAPPFSGVIRFSRPNLRRFVELRVIQVGVEAALGE